MAGEVSNNGMTSAAYALRYWERRQEVVANNLANVNTEGFKGERVFSRLLGNEPLPVIQSATDSREGTLRPTGAALDLALDGAGYFVVNTSTGEQLSRGGSFHIDDQRHIVDADGNTLLSQNGAVTLPREGGRIEIQKDGVLLVDGKEMAKLRVETVPNTVRLQHAGGSRYLADPARTPLAPTARGVRQGFVEDSNVGTVESMVDMISVQRAYASIQKAMITLDGVRGTIAMDLGKPV
jgi:flagellar basal-body rod protein FlgF